MAKFWFTIIASCAMLGENYFRKLNLYSNQHLCISSNNSEDQQDTIDQKSKLVEEAVQKAKEANNLFPDDINK